MVVRPSLYGYGDAPLTTVVETPPSRAVWFALGFGACYALLGWFLKR